MSSVEQLEAVTDHYRAHNERMAVKLRGDRPLEGPEKKLAEVASQHKKFNDQLEKDLREWWAKR